MENDIIMKLCYFTWCQGELRMVLKVSFMAFFPTTRTERTVVKHILPGSGFVSMWLGFK